MLDSQRALFSTQEGLVASQGGVVQYLIAVYKAMGGGWQAGRARPVLDDATQATMSERSDWNSLLQAPLPPPSAAVPPSDERLTMSQDPAVSPDQPAPNAGPAPVPPPAPAAPAPAPAPAPAGRGSRVGALVIAVLIVASLVLYFVGDRLTPSTSQARVQAFVVPVAAEVAGKVLAVHIHNNDEVQPGQPLFDIDPQPYRIALARARADLESVRSSVKGSVAGVEAAQASLAVSEASRDMAERDASRLEKLLRGGSRRDLGAPPRDRPGHARRGAQQGEPRAAPTCARRRRPPAKRATTTRSCAARWRRSRRPNSTWRARTSLRRRAAWSPTCAPTSASLPSPARR